MLTSPDAGRRSTITRSSRSLTCSSTGLSTVEDVVVRREANERVETVRDTVRETKVDVDKEPTDRRVDVGRANPPNRNS